MPEGEAWRSEYLRNGYGLPVLGGLLALAVGGTRLPLSLRWPGKPSTEARRAP